MEAMVYVCLQHLWITDSGQCNSSVCKCAHIVDIVDGAKDSKGGNCQLLWDTLFNSLVHKRPAVPHVDTFIAIAWNSTERDGTCN